MKRLRHTMMVHANTQVAPFQVLATMIHLGMYWMPMPVILIVALDAPIQPLATMKKAIPLKTVLANLQMPVMTATVLA